MQGRGGTFPSRLKREGCPKLKMGVGRKSRLSQGAGCCLSNCGAARAARLHGPAAPAGTPASQAPSSRLSYAHARGWVASSTFVPPPARDGKAPFPGLPQGPCLPWAAWAGRGLEPQGQGVQGRADGLVAEGEELCHSDRTLCLLGTSPSGVSRAVGTWPAARAVVGTGLGSPASSGGGVCILPACLPACLGILPPGQLPPRG